MFRIFLNYKNYILHILASGVTQEKQKLVLLLHIGGKEVGEIYQALKCETDNYKTTLETLYMIFQS